MENKPLHMLIIEDDPDDFKLVEDLLSDSPDLQYELDWAKTYGAGVEQIHRHSHDVILLDYRLGEYNGIDLLRKAIADGCKAPIIFLTALENRAVDIMAMEEGAADYLSKNNITAELLERSIRYSIKQKQTEKSLAGSEKRFQKLSQEFNTLLDAIPDRITLISPDLTILWANKSAAEEAGLDVATLTGRHCHEVWKDLASACDYCPVQKSFVSGKSETVEVSTADEKFWSIWAYPVRNKAGEVVSVIEMVEDVTDRVALQTEAMRSAHLASLGELAAGVAHEVNNPINCIINYAQLLSRRSSEWVDQNEIGNRIIKEGTRIAGIVRSLLSFARENREGKAPVHVRQILSDTLALMESIILKEGIHFVVDLPPDLPEIIANPQQIQQVFLNIVSNARYSLNEKYPGADKNKILEIHARKTTNEGRDYVRIGFTDHGSGVPAEIIDKIMLPFFSTKPTGKGTGLGLCISHGIVNDHGGKIVIRSEKGEWAEILVDLPAAKDRHE